MTSGNLLTDLPKFLVIFHRQFGWRLYALLGIAIVIGLTEFGSISMLVPVVTGGDWSDASGKLSQALNSLFEFLTGGDPSLGKKLVVAGGFLVFWKAAEWFGEAWRIVMTTQFLAELRNQFAGDIWNLNYKAYLQEKSGELTNVLGTQIQAFVSSIGPFFEVLKGAVQIMIYLLAALFFEWRIAVACGLAGFLIVPLAAPFNRMRQKLSLQLARRQSRIQDLLIQFLRNFKYLKSTGSGGVVLDHLGQEVEMARREGVTNQLGVVTLRFWLQVGAGFAVFGSMYVAGSVLGRSMEVVVILTAVIYRAGIGTAVLHESWVKFCAASGALRLVQEARERLESGKELADGKQIPKFETGIKLEDVSLSYGEKEVIRNVSLEIAQNEVIGIAGESGAGKSTVLNVLTGLAEPTSGQVQMDNISYRQLDLGKLRKLFGYVTQETMLFNDSVADNITLWHCHDEGERDRLEKVATATGALKVAERSADGLDTVVGEQGMQLSGGERQKISLARELYRDPEILILDEATASLDSRSEKEINRCIEEFRGIRTIVVVAHRLASLRGCDRIYVMSDGQVVEAGGWEELINSKEGKFRGMCLAQGLVT